MSNEIDVYGGGEIAPYDAGMPVLAPLQPDTWGETTDVDLLREDQHRQFGSSPQIFGQPLPQGTTDQQVRDVIARVGSIFLTDFTTLGYPAEMVQFASTFFVCNAPKPSQQVRANHSFKLPNDLSGDWLANKFANELSSQSGTQHQKQQFLNAVLIWLGKLSALTNSQGSKPTPRMAPNSTADPTDALSDTQYAQVEKANNQAQQQTYTYLKSLWGQSFDANLRMTNSYLASLPLREQQSLDRYTTGWIHALNTKEVILGLYQQALRSLPSSGTVAGDIAEYERMMKYERKRWNSSEVMQAHYRQLITLRDER